MPARVDIGDIFKELIWGPLVKAAIARLFAAVPFLGWGPIGIVVSIVLTKLANWLYDEVEMYISLQLIVLKNAAHHRAFVDASLNLKEVALAKGIESKEFQEARDAHKKRLAEFVHMGPR